MVRARGSLLFIAVALLLAGAVWAQNLPGQYNAITDVPGLKVGSYDERLTGTTVLLLPPGTVGGVDVRGSAPGTRETDLLAPLNMVDRVDAFVLSGGSAYGLAAADGVMLWLEQHGQGWPVGGGNVVPIVPAAILYDPGRFGREFTFRPTAEFGRMACELAAAGPLAQGNVGAGAGARSGGLKGGLGTASIDLGNGIFVGAIVAVNSGGSTVNTATEEFYARYLELDDEFSVLKQYKLGSLPGSKEPKVASLAEIELVKNTTIAVVATNFKLTKAQAQKVAQMAHDGLARAIDPIHTMGDGDTVFSAATGQITAEMGIPGWTNMTSVVSRLGAAAANTLARAVIHAMLNAESVGTTLSYRDKYPNQMQNQNK